MRRFVSDPESLLRARGTHPQARATADPAEPRYAQVVLGQMPPWLEPMSNFGRAGRFIPEMTRTATEGAGELVRTAPEAAGRTAPAETVPEAPNAAPRTGPRTRVGDQLRPATAPRSDERQRRKQSYSAAFRPDFFAYGDVGYRTGETRARRLRSDAKLVQREGWGTAVLLVEHQIVGKGRFVVAGINGSFNANQHAVLDQLRIVERYNLRDRYQTLGHPDVTVTFGQVGAITSHAVAIGSSVPFCPICLRMIDGAGFELVSDIIYTGLPEARGVRHA